MKKVMLIWVLILLLPAIGRAETQYISGVLQITLRSGPGTDHRVLAMLKTGNRVEIITTEGDWTQVRLENGKEGWILSRFLTDKEPHSVMLEQIQQKNEELSSQFKSLQEIHEKQKSSNKWLESELAETKKKLKQAVAQYEALKKESSEFLKMKTEYKKSSSELAQQIEKGQAMEMELSQLRLQKNIKWFLSGAGVLVVGFLLGLSAKRQRRRSSLL